jgi:hypothetical protein
MIYICENEMQSTELLNITNACLTNDFFNCLIFNVKNIIEEFKSNIKAENKQISKEEFIKFIETYEKYISVNLDIMQYLINKFNANLKTILSKNQNKMINGYIGALGALIQETVTFLTLLNNFLNSNNTKLILDTYAGIANNFNLFAEDKINEKFDSLINQITDKNILNFLVRQNQSEKSIFYLGLFVYLIVNNSEAFNELANMQDEKIKFFYYNMKYLQDIIENNKYFNFTLGFLMNLKYMDLSKFLNIEIHKDFKNEIKKQIELINLTSTKNNCTISANDLEKFMKNNIMELNSAVSFQNHILISLGLSTLNQLSKETDNNKLNTILMCFVSQLFNIIEVLDFIEKFIDYNNIKNFTNFCKDLSNSFARLDKKSYDDRIQNYIKTYLNSKNSKILENKTIFSLMSFAFTYYLIINNQGLIDELINKNNKIIENNGADKNNSDIPKNHRANEEKMTSIVLINILRCFKNIINEYHSKKK